MSNLKDRPIVVVVIVVVLLGVVALAWRQYRGMTTVPKEKTIQMTPEELRDAMRRDN